MSAQRNPEKKEAEMMRKKPIGLNSASPATIIMTPTVIVAIIRISFTEGCSRWNKKAKIRMNASAEDLHIAKQCMLVQVGQETIGRLTEECERDPSETHIPQPNIKASCCSTRTNPGQVEGPTHEGFALQLVTMEWRVIPRVGDAVCSGPKMREEIQDTRGQQKLHCHVHTCGE